MKRPLVSLVGVSKSYGRTVAVNRLSLEAGEGEFVTLLGPSGSGKTTTLMLVAGFEQPTSGEILMRGEAVVGRPPEKRDIGMVFQSYALFPHMTVFDNLAFPLKTRRVAGPAIAKQVEEALAAVRMPGLGGRYPRQLSGGQQQRIALARALVYRPSLLLMDEPLGALDKKLREEMQGEIKTLQRELGITTLYVTHDQQEALALSDRIAIMNGGDVIQVDSPLALYERPATEFVAGFLGDVNLVEGVAIETGGNLARIQLVDGPEVVTLDESSLSPGKRVRLTIRPERLEIWTTAPAGLNAWPGRIREAVFNGELVRYGVEVPSRAVFRVTRPFRGPDALLAAGQGIWLASRPEDWRLFA